MSIGFSTTTWRPDPGCGQAHLCVLPAWYADANDVDVGPAQQLVQAAGVGGAVVSGELGRPFGVYVGHGHEVPTGEAVQGRGVRARDHATTDEAEAEGPRAHTRHRSRSISRYSLHGPLE